MTNNLYRHTEALAEVSFRWVKTQPTILLLGPIGAVVGGISGMGKKEIYHYYLLITYGADDNTVLLKSYDKSPKTCEKVINLIQKNRKDDCLYQWL